MCRATSAMVAVLFRLSLYCLSQLLLPLLSRAKNFSNCSTRQAITCSRDELYPIRVALAIQPFSFAPTSISQRLPRTLMPRQREPTPHSSLSLYFHSLPF